MSGGTAQGLQASAGDLVLLWSTRVTAVVVTLAVAFLGALALANPWMGYFIGMAVIPLAVWLVAVWVPVRTFGEAFRSGSFVRQRHAGVPRRYRVLAVTALAAEVVGLLAVFVVPGQVPGIPVTLVLSAVAATVAVAVVTRVTWHRDSR